MTIGDGWLLLVRHTPQNICAREIILCVSQSVDVLSQSRTSEFVWRTAFQSTTTRFYESNDRASGTVTGARNLSRVSGICKIESRIGFGKLRPTTHWCLGPG